jgi:hypothetical protein
MLVFRGGSVLREVGEAGCVPTAAIVIQLSSGFGVLTHKKKIPPAGVRALTSHCPVGSDSVIVVYLAFVGAIAPRWFGADVVRWSAFQLPLV